MAIRSFFHVLWRCLFVFSLFFLCFPQSSVGDEELENTLRCALVGKFEKKCRLEGPELKPHMIDLLKRSPASFRELLRGRFDDLQPTLVGKIPVPLIYLLPVELWSRVPPKAVSELIKSHKKNEAIARSVLRGYANATSSNKQDFLISVDYSNMDRSVVSIIGTEISSNWALDDDDITTLASPSFFVALPEAYILEMGTEQRVAMLDKIVAWDRNELDKEKWYNLPAITKRIWSIISRNYTWKGSDKRTTTPLLGGATPSELREEGKSFSEYELMAMPLQNRLQIRALFPIARPEDRLTRFDLNLLKNWILLLSPDQILKFREDLEFMYVVKEKQHEYWSQPSHRKAFARPSVPTLRQIIEITTMVNNEKQLLPLDPKKWRNEIALFGPLAYLIGARRLGKLEMDQENLKAHTLKEIDSYHFSKRMARHFMADCSTSVILKMRGLLRGLSTGHFVRWSESGHDEINNWRGVVKSIPYDFPARTALVFRKIREDLGFQMSWLH